jgi:hypothetical protein
MWKKVIAFSTICAFDFVVNWALAGIGSGLVLLSEQFNTDISTTAKGTINWVVLTIGLAVVPG